MVNLKKRAFLYPSRKLVFSLVVIAIAGNVAGKILSPNGPSGGVRGLLGDVGMAVFFLVGAYLLIVALTRLGRRRPSGSA